MLSRRAFVVTSLGAMVPRLQAPAGLGGPTAQEVFETIKSGLGTPWRDKTVDGFKAGDPATRVTGIATTVMATMDVLRRAAAARRNLIVTREPVFYSGNDEPGNRAADPVYLAKKAFIEARGLVVLRLGDHWTTRVPNDSVRALAQALGWIGHPSAKHDAVFTPPATTVGEVASLVQKRLGARGLRVVGAPDMRVTSILLSPGTTDLPGTVRDLRLADLVIAGEPREWEAVPYVLDTGPAGQPKALIALGRLVSEEPAAKACETWLRTLLPALPIETIPVADPFWKAVP